MRPSARAGLPAAQSSQATRSLPVSAQVSAKVSQSKTLRWSTALSQASLMKPPGSSTTAPTISTTAPPVLAHSPPAKPDSPAHSRLQKPGSLGAPSSAAARAAAV
ncbi:MAG: hypothetical protein KY450_14555, partial [Actinobacteria bacterium]|nr:hypothetical protein [Actinomycetota bacterium]